MGNREERSLKKVIRLGHPLGQACRGRRRSLLLHGFLRRLVRLATAAPPKHSILNRLTDLMPLARFGVGPGQMPSAELESVMRKFLRHEIDVWVWTTIVESGLDFPAAYTIIIDKADIFGLGQLYQLRGRVGRGWTTTQPSAPPRSSSSSARSSTQGRGGPWSGSRSFWGGSPEGFGGGFREILRGRPVGAPFCFARPERGSGDWAGVVEKDVWPRGRRRAIMMTDSQACDLSAGRID
jgi:hypothetical protein